MLKIQEGSKQNFYAIIGAMNAFFIMLGPYLFFKSQYLIYVDTLSFEDINTILNWIKISSIASILSACLTILLGNQFPTRQFEGGNKYGYSVFLSMIVFGLGIFLCPYQRACYIKLFA